MTDAPTLRVRERVAASGESSAIDATERATGTSSLSIDGAIEFENRKDPVRLRNIYAGDNGAADGGRRGSLCGHLTATVSTAEAAGDQIVIGLVTKTEVNPYFVKLRQAATAEAEKQGAKLIARFGKFDGDNEGQVAAVEDLISAGVKGILITPNNSTGMLGIIKKARDKGVLVIALDTATDPADAVDATLATDNFEAGVLQGQYARKALGDKQAPLKAVLGGRTPQQAAEAYVAASKLRDPAERRRANAKSEDGMIRLAAILDEPARKLGKKHEEVIGALETSAAGKIVSPSKATRPSSGSVTMRLRLGA